MSKWVVWGTKPRTGRVRSEGEILAGGGHREDIQAAGDLPLERDVHSVRGEHRQAVLRIVRFRPRLCPGKLTGVQQHRHEPRDDERQMPFHGQPRYDASSTED